MKRSESINLAVMGVAAFTATFAGASYFSRASTPTPSAQCAPRPDGTQICERRGGSAVYLVHGASSAADPKTPQGAALTSNTRSLAPASSTGIQRGGFGTTASSGSFRISSGG